MNFTPPHDAPCIGHADLFFTPDSDGGNHKERGYRRDDREEAAKALCLGPPICPVLMACRAHALTEPEPYGVWGGLGETERAHLRRHRRRAVA